jgi:MoxR-like ATPase
MGTDAAQPRAGRAQLNRMAMALGTERMDGERPDYGVPPSDRMPHGSRAVFFSDFLGDIETLKPVLAHAADQGVRGCFVQVLDETEETFPFDGRMIFESMGRTAEFETQRARALRTAYEERLAERREKIIEYARHLGWRWYFHDTTAPPRKALLWLYMALGERA